MEPKMEWDEDGNAYCTRCKQSVPGHAAHEHPYLCGLDEAEKEPE